LNSKELASVGNPTSKHERCRSCARLAHDPDLAAIIDAWPTLPAALRRAMLALIERDGNPK